MKKWILTALLLGVVLPLLILTVGGDREVMAEPTYPEVESSGLTCTVPEYSWDETNRVMVLSDTGNIRQMDMKTYLIGVVLAEMPAEFEEEALKAQAVVARTYTCKRMEGSKHGSAAVCMKSGCCQGYRKPEDYLAAGGKTENIEKIQSAVEATDGEVLVYCGTLIDATYFSCSGGSTEDAQEVWGRDVPYLQAVESPGEENAPRYEEQIRYKPENFKLMTGVSGRGNVADWFGQVTYTDGGGVDTIVICGKKFTGTELRTMLGLRSTMFTIAVSDGKIVIKTKGYGHRVGMSQYGAEAMAVSGSGYEQILRHYYTGAALIRQTA